MRLFVAITPPPAALGELEAAVAPVRGQWSELRPSRPSRPFRPHLTLARGRIPADARALVRALSGYQGPSWTADRRHLIHSRLGQQPRYATVGSWAIGGG